MVGFNERSGGHMVTLDIQCWQLRGYSDEGSGNLGIGMTPTFSSRRMNQKY